VAAKELDGVHEVRVQRGGPPHPRRPGTSPRAAAAARRVLLEPVGRLARLVVQPEPLHLEVVLVHRRRVVHLL